VALEEILPQVEARMRKAIDALKHELSGVELSGPQARLARIGNSQTASAAAMTQKAPIQRRMLAPPPVLLPRLPTRRHLMLASRQA